MAGGRYFTSQEAVVEEPNQFDMEWTCGFEYKFYLKKNKIESKGPVSQSYGQLKLLLV